jgi:hypothetical protein
MNGTNARKRLNPLGPKVGAAARGRRGGRPYTMTPAKLRLARAAMGQPETHGGALCRELGIAKQTLCRYVGPKGELRPDGEKLLARRRGGESGIGGAR